MEDQTSESLEEAEEQIEDTTEDNYELSQEVAEAYGAPAPEDKNNQWTILSKAIERKDAVRTTFLTKEELGKPLFSVRFLMDMEDITYHYLKDDFEKRGLDPYKHNKLARYFQDKYQNTAASGMSNQGFMMNLSVTRKTDTTKKRIKEVPNNGGKTKP